MMLLTAVQWNQCIMDTLGPFIYAGVLISSTLIKRFHCISVEGNNCVNIYNGWSGNHVLRVFVDIHYKKMYKPINPPAFADVAYKCRRIIACLAVGELCYIT